MRAGHKRQGRLACHVVHWNPKADILPSFNVIVRLVLMYRRRLQCIGLFDEHMIMV
eukprot:CAMPEP_0119303764 /NCGR_PEP_ID=MMETSP1333-20130426/5146_1 /TAXON_ID=418940 /ORGANISM="Scyphosphaera apsteinii, Strain RCC1455" /LENGTH=55 /DNA_ID=CAMNT_0007306517 /DNA_START=523 /DNA_END=690 /DNA_ORIENTATION=-